MEGQIEMKKIFLTVLILLLLFSTAALFGQSEPVLFSAAEGAAVSAAGLEVTRPEIVQAALIIAMITLLIVVSVITLSKKIQTKLFRSDGFRVRQNGGAADRLIFPTV